ncbi:MAG: hypothetical protein IIB42_02055 [Candidatus Marinimicrobia bacterium]|nr:hypothetical protein [Candidatus Neomarinimicrobiota bacterium]
MWSHNIHRAVIWTSLVLLIVMAGCELSNLPPIIQIQAENLTPLTGSIQTLTAVVEDPDEDPVIITWSATAAVSDSGMKFSKSTGVEVTWTAPLDIQEVVITVVADDRKFGGKDSSTITLSVINGAPRISEFASSSPFVILGNAVELTVVAEDPDGENITYAFSSQSGVGTFTGTSPEVNTATWLAPSVSQSPFSRVFNLIVKVSDEQNFFSTDTLAILVYSEDGTMWIVDSGHRTVSKYTSNGNFIFTANHPFSYPVAAANNTEAFFGCYVADRGAGEVVKINAFGLQDQIFSGLPNVVDLAVHEVTNTLWIIDVGDEGRGPALTVIDAISNVEIKRVFGFVRPESIEINQRSGDIWISDVGNNTLVQFSIANLTINDLLEFLPDTLSQGNATIFESFLNGPVSISVVDEVEATLYIADISDDEVERLVYNAGSYSRSSPVAVNQPSLVSATTVGGLVWVMDSNSKILQYFSDDLTQQGSLNANYIFRTPHVMTAGSGAGDIWIGDNGTHEVVQIVNPDSVGATIAGFNFIEDIIVNR